MAMGDNNNTNDNNILDNPKQWTFPLAAMRGMTPQLYQSLVNQAQNPQLEQKCAAVIAGFMCIGKTYFGARWQPSYGKHRVVNLEFNQYRGQQKGGGVNTEAYLDDALVAAKFIPGAIVVVNCHEPLRRAMRAHGLAYVRVFPDFADPAVKEAWRRRVLQRGLANSAAGGAAAAAEAAQRSAERMMACWDEWSEMGQAHDWEEEEDNNHNKSRVVVFGENDYLSSCVDTILEVAARA